MMRGKNKVFIFFKFLVFISYFLFFNNLTLAQSKNKTLLFIGSYTQGRSDSGIYIFDFNTKSGKLTRLNTITNVINPSFITLSPDGKYLYACTETKLPKEGSVSAFKIDSLRGDLSFLNKQPSGGDNPVYLTVHPTDRFVVNGNYNGGNVSVFGLKEDGSLKPYSQLIQFTGSSVNEARQDAAHIHATVFSTDGAFLFLPDLGADKIRVFAFDADKSKPISDSGSLTIKTLAGTGPRHFVFHPNQKFAYCIEELSGMVSVYNYAEGRLDSIQHVFSYSKKQETYGGSDIHISGDGKFLYASNRWVNENTISIFSINQQCGKLTLIGHQPTFGEHPRNFAIDPSGNFLLVANQFTGNIVIFKRNKKSGLLKKRIQEIHVPSPSCLQMRMYKN